MRWADAYCDMLCTLNILSLEGGIKLLRLCHLYKIVHRFVDFPNAPLLYKPCTKSGYIILLAFAILCIHCTSCIKFT